MKVCVIIGIAIVMAGCAHNTSVPKEPPSAYNDDDIKELVIRQRNNQVRIQALQQQLSDTYNRCDEAAKARTE